MISILLVDDQPAFLEMARRFLEKDRDIHVSTAVSGEQALELLEERRFDVIISDYVMPGTNGIELLKTIRSYGYYTPVIIYASQGRDNVTIEAMYHGAEFILHKSGDVEGQFSELRYVVKEIVRRRRAEIARQRREKDFHAIVDKNADAMVVLDHEGIVRYANPAALELFSMTEEELVGQMIGFPIVLSEPVDMYVLRHFREFVAVEMRMVEVEWEEKPSYLISFRDITGHIRLEEELGRARDELELRVRERTTRLVEANEKLKAEIEERRSTEEELRVEIGQREMADKALKEAKAQADLYLDLMGHDINNLNQIGIGYLELALQAGSLEEAKTLIEKPLDVMKSASEIISNVRKVKLISDDQLRQAHNLQIIDLCQVLPDLKERYTNVSGRKITVNLVAPQTCQVMANELIKDVFSNLIGNSIKHSDPDKPLTINVKVEKRVEKNKSYYLCIVEDNGPGIPDWIKDKIFERYQRGATKAHGKGLGLFLVKKLVYDYHGSVWVENRVPGDYTQGTKFTILLPAAD